MFGLNKLTYLFCVLSLIWGVSSFASDGVLEINQACVATGCFAGDAAGFPVRVTQAGSYIFTSDLDVRGEANPEDVNAVEVQTSDPEGVVIDLNGFRIIGPTNCPGTPPVKCSPAGTGVGVFANDNNVTIRNGRIFGMGDKGVRLVSASKVEDMQIESCAGDGIDVGAGSLILNNIVRRNGGNGITSPQHSLVMENVIFANIGLGINGHATMGYGNNLISQNTGGAVGAGVQLGANLCDTALCP